MSFTTPLLTRLARGTSVLALAGSLVAGTAVTAQAATPTGTPQGNVDNVSAVTGGVRVRGWAWDPNTGQSVSVAVSAGSSQKATSAWGYRPDVARVFPAAGSYRGFDTVVPTGNGPQNVCVTARNVGAGVNKAFTCTTVVVGSRSPFGNLESTAAVAGGLRVSGWAADWDATAPVAVDIAVAGTTRRVSANLTRTDVQSAFPALSASTGFSLEVPLPAGNHQVCVTAVNVGAGSNHAFGCRTVTVAAPEPAPAPAPVVVTSSTATAPGAAVRGNSTNTGVPAGKVLTRHDGNLVITTPGAVIDGLDVRGFVDVRAAGVVIRNTIVRGGPTTTDRGLVTVGSPAYSVTIEDSELAPATASPYIDGLRGMNITARRVNIHRVIDSVHIYGSNVLVEASWLHDNAFFASDPKWNGGPSHNDNVQIQIGDNITLRNNTMTSTRNAAIMLTQDRGLVSNLTVTNNYLDHGACIVNIKNMPTAPKNVSLRDNTFGRGAIYRTCGLKVPNSSYVLDLQRNLFTDGVAVTRIL